MITHRNFDRRITELTEEIEELKFEKARLLKAMERSDDKDVATINDSFDRLESALAELDEREKRYTAELNEVLRQYDEYKEQAKEFNDGEFGKARLDIRSDKEYAVHEQLSKAYGKHFDPLTLVSSRSEIDSKLDDEINMPAVREYVYQQRKQAHQQQKRRKTHDGRCDY